MVVLLFFGAGASRPFEIPTMQEMVVSFENSLKDVKPEAKALYTKIKGILEKSYPNSQIDIEAVFSVIQGIANKITSKDLGYLAHYILTSSGIMKEFNNIEIENAQFLKSRLEDFIKKTCRCPLNNDKRNTIYEQSYSVLFSNLPGSRTNFSDVHSYNLEWFAYTTNYENIFEEFWADFITINDNFDPEGSSRHQVFNAAKKLEVRSLTKLHGSLDWLREESGRIIKIGSEFTRHTTEGEVMLFPIQQKDLYLHPWITLFQHLKGGLERTNQWFVVGYAFNDEFIFNSFKEALRVGKELFIISPSAKKLRNKFPANQRTQIFALPIKFGDKYFPIQFNDFLKEKKVIEFRIKTPSPNMFFKSSVPLEFVSINDGDPTDIKLGGVTYNPEKTHMKIPITHPPDKDVRVKFNVEYKRPFVDNLEIMLLFGQQHEFEYSIYLQDVMIDSLKGNADKEDPELHWFYSKPSIISADQLFI